jgi:hypothetical protein
MQEMYADYLLPGTTADFVLHIRRSPLPLKRLREEHPAIWAALEARTCCAMQEVDPLPPVFLEALREFCPAVGAGRGRGGAKQEPPAGAVRAGSSQAGAAEEACAGFEPSTALRAATAACGVAPVRWEETDEGELVAVAAGEGALVACTIGAQRPPCMFPGVSNLGRVM